MNISGVNPKFAIGNSLSPNKDAHVENKDRGIEQFSSKASNASLAYGLAQVSVNRASQVTEQAPPSKAQQGTINLFYFSDTHGELAGLSKLAAAQEACKEYCGGELTVLGAGDLIAGKQSKVIAATVDVVNEMGMEATALGNHERGRSDEKLSGLADDLKPEILAINATDNEKENCQILPSMVLKQGNQEFIAVGAQPLTPVDDPIEIAKSIDTEVSRIKAERKEQGLNENLPVVFLSHMGSTADKAVAENSDTVSVILGGHTHNVEDFTYTSKNGRNVQVLQGGANNAHATVIKMDVAEDGSVTTSAKMLNLNGDAASICADLGSFYGVEPEQQENVTKAALDAEKNAEGTVANRVGKRVDIAQVEEGYGYNADPLKERNYSNPVGNIMADAMLESVQDKGINIAFFQSATVKDTTIPDNKMLTNYDILGRMVPFGGDVVVADMSVDQLYSIIEKQAQSIIAHDDSQLIQCAGMTYSVNTDKAKARFDADIEVMAAQKGLKEANASGDKTAIADAQTKLAEAQDKYNSLPGCIEKIMVLNPDGSELKINPKAIARGDYDGQQVKCALNDYLASITLGDGNYENTNIKLGEIFEKQLTKVKEENDGKFFVDQNETRIAINDKNGLLEEGAIDSPLHTKYWY